MLLSELRPGMENVDLKITLMKLEEERIVFTHSGFKHRIVEGKIKDQSISMNLTVWNEKIEDLKGIAHGDDLILINCFISSFKGVLSVNVGKNSVIKKNE
jgi:replication factor A1